MAGVEEINSGELDSVVSQLGVGVDETLPDVGARAHTNQTESTIGVEQPIVSINLVHRINLDELAIVSAEAKLGGVGSSRDNKSTESSQGEGTRDIGQVSAVEAHLHKGWLTTAWTLRISTDSVGGAVHVPNDGVVSIEIDVEVRIGIDANYGGQESGQAVGFGQLVGLKGGYCGHENVSTCSVGRVVNCGLSLQSVFVNIKIGLNTVETKLVVGGIDGLEEHTAEHDVLGGLGAIIQVFNEDGAKTTLKIGVSGESGQGNAHKGRATVASEGDLEVVVPETGVCIMAAWA